MFIFTTGIPYSDKYEYYLVIIHFTVTVLPNVYYKTERLVVVYFHYWRLPYSDKYDYVTHFANSVLVSCLANDYFLKKFNKLKNLKALINIEEAKFR